ncbi:alpha/beta hydrolase family protein [Actinoallomurus bryophytorum]
MTVAPAACTLAAAPGAVRVTAPAGTAAWRADGRHLPDPVTADPVTVHRFLAAAGTAEQRELAAEYPGVLGGLDGAPVASRYAANRRAMDAAGPPYRGRPGRYLLFDARGDGRVAQVFGDLRAADRIAVLVPGAGARGANFWTGVGGRRFRSPAVQAAGLYREAARYGGRIAVIAWLGYETPKGIEAAEAREDLARAGAAALERFVAGLVAVRPGATVALLGHSYGSTVIGTAAPRLPAQVTDLAVFGSPGMGVHDVTGLGTSARVWAGQSARDWIRWVPGVQVFGLGHGTKPADPAFGAQVFPTADVTGHDHYLSPGTDSLTALARIAAYGGRT